MGDPIESKDGAQREPRTRERNVNGDETHPERLEAINGEKCGVVNGVSWSISTDKMAARSHRLIFK